MRTICLMKQYSGHVATESFGTPTKDHEADDLLKAPLLHLATRPTRGCLAVRNRASRQAGSGGMVFDQIASMAQANVHGIGFACCRSF